YYGSLPSLDMTELPIIEIVPTPDGGGYYMVGTDGGVYAFGDARFEGSCATIGGCGKLTVTGLLAGPNGDGYWLLLSNCTMIAFGAAPKTADPDCQVRAVASRAIAKEAVLTPDGQGYWALLESGSVFAEGDAKAYGHWEASAVPVKKVPAVALLPTRDGHGAWLVFANGKVEDLGDARPVGGLAGTKLNAPIFSAASS
ncbi:MAG: hypothetical protein ACRDZX_05120, partial [Acidimicrobiales bacterium]